MSGSLTRPDFSADIAALARRLDALERRTTPKPPDVPAGHTHDGAGDYSTIVHPSADTTGDAAGVSSVTCGDGATARADEGTAVGAYADAVDYSATALGMNSEAGGEYSTAVGSHAVTGGNNAVAVGNAATALDASATATGYNTNASAPSSSAFGVNADASHEHSTAIGADAGDNSSYQVVLGTNLDAVIIRGQLVLWSTPGGIPYVLVVSDAGVLSTVAY